VAVSRPGSHWAPYALATVPIRVVLGEDSFIMREGIREVLAGSQEVELVATGGAATELLEAIEREAPDVVLTDIRMPPSMRDEGIKIAAGLRESHPEIGVVILSQYSEPSYAVRLLSNGAERRAYLLKERVHDREQLVAAITAVADGGSVVDPKVVEVLIGARARAASSPLSELTPRELEVLAAIAEGKSNTAIAESLVLTKRAVEKHINAIFLKLGLTHSAHSEEISKRVMAALVFLSEQDGAPAS
jgi:DNA-binding NarL/FixJ family response regulator